MRRVTQRARGAAAAAAHARACRLKSTVELSHSTCSSAGAQRSLQAHCLLLLAVRRLLAVASGRCCPAGAAAPAGVHRHARSQQVFHSREAAPAAVLRQTSLVVVHAAGGRESSSTASGVRRARQQHGRAASMVQLWAATLTQQRATSSSGAWPAVRARKHTRMHAEHACYVSLQTRIAFPRSLGKHTGTHQHLATPRRTSPEGRWSQPARHDKSRRACTRARSGAARQHC